MVALAGATTAHTDSRGFEIGNGNYRVDWVDAAFAYGVGVREVILTVVHADVYTENLRVELGKYGYNALIDGGTTIESVDDGPTTPVQFTLTRGGGDPNSLLNAVIIARDADGDPSYRIITSYSGGSREIVIDAAFDFDPVAGDGIEVYPAVVAPTVEEFRDALLDRVLNGNHDTAGTLGLLVQATGLVISQRTNNADLGTLLGVSDTATYDIKRELLNIAITGAVADSIFERVTSIDNLITGAPSTFDPTTDPVDVNRIDGSEAALDVFARLLDAHVRGSADSGTTTTMVDEARDETEATAFVGQLISFTSGTNINRTFLITGFTPGSPATMTFFPASADAVTIENYIIIPVGPANLMAVVGTTQTAGDIPALVTTADAAIDVAVADLANGIDGLTVLMASLTDVQSRLPAALISGRMDSDVEAVNDDTDAAIKLAAHSLETIPVTFSAGGSTTTAVLNQVDGAGASAVDNVYNGRILVFNLSTLNHQIAEITSYDGGTTTATISEVTTAPGTGHTARMI